jgi:hypothetical protein
MPKKRSSKSTFPYDGFPYRAFWEEHGGDWVSFEDIAANADHYLGFIEMSDVIGLKLPNPTPADFEELVAMNSPEFTRRLRASCFAAVRN